ncbi:MAG: ABC transporter permease, partial [Gallionellaceae bacterium]|nr:ABC transporter permease [Gallionellaceae bacterium]
MSKFFFIRKHTLLVLGSFLLPLLIWSAVSYLPFVWHPKILVEQPGGVDYFNVGMLVDKSVFNDELANMQTQHLELPQGIAANPIYLPAPHEVAKAFYTAFVTPPPQKDMPWLHESLWHSITIIFWGFLLSSLIGVPLGILSGTYPTLARLSEPFIEFFRYLPAPA